MVLSRPPRRLLHNILPLLELILRRNFSVLKRFFFVAFVWAAVAGCSSGKKDQSWAGKVWHNTNAHYNGYYYAKLKMTEVENSVLASRKDDFDKLLPIYLLGNPEDQFSGNDLDSIIKRLTVVVKLHPKSKWADDCYFNIGKAYYYKKDYESASAAFQFVSSEFKDTKQGTSSSSKKKKKKKSSSKDKNVNEYTGTVKEIKESSGFKMFAHKPIHYTDVLWLARSHAMLRNFGEAQAILSYLDQDPKFPAEKKADLALLHAFVSVEQKQYRNAIEPMKNAIKLTKNKKSLTRYTYILAQLYQYSGDYGTAGKTFASVSDLTPTYEMDFYARINVVKNYIASGSGSPTQIISDLEAMAKNDNFSEFYDQIYYYIGLVHLKQGKDEEAIRDFESSIGVSYGNNHQKGLSFLKIGEMMMADQDYVTAAPYYDSATVFLTDKLDTLARVQHLGTILKDLSNQMRIITTEDSLQRLAQMSEKDRKRVIDQMVEKAEREQAEKEEQENVTYAFPNAQNQNAGNQSQGGTWYFYNATLRASGYTEFQQRWGPRANEDNWRRSNKRISAGAAEGEEAQGEKSEATDTIYGGSQLAKKLLENVPLTEEKMKQSEKKVFEAYYNIARIYQSELNNLPKAVATYETMSRRFEDNPDLAKVYYNMYLIYSQQGNSTGAEANRQRIFNEFPQSVYASILRDPDYFRKQQEKENEVNVYYASAYNDFVGNNYKSVLQRTMKADTMFQPNPLQAKFDLLEAMAIGKTQDRNAYIAALDSIVAKYPSGEEHDKAVEILTLIGAPPKAVNQKQTAASKNEEGKLKVPVPYQYRPDNPQYLVVAFNVVSAQTKAIGDSLANFNSRYHSIDNLKVQPQLLDPKSQMIVVKQFANRDDAMNYYDEITDSETLFEQVESLGYRIFVIDDKSFPLFYQRKNIQEYADFFEEHYFSEYSED
jgi:tetratricopeptide (TPR) repeat protein